MFGVRSHEPLDRIDQDDHLQYRNTMVGEDTPCIMPAIAESGFFLPTNFVSIPTKEEGHITLRQQMALSAMATEQQPAGVKKWHHKAIRRNISKSKELVLFVGGVKCNLPEAHYISYAAQCAKAENKSSIGPIYPALGCFFITFLSGTSASNALKLFRLTRFHGKIPELILLPYINAPAYIPKNKCGPLLVFINMKSGGGQGSQLAELMEEVLNPYQIFVLDRGGAIPGLFAFRKLPCFRVLVCGGDGTVGWVLSHLQEVQRHLVCRNPPIAVLPVGTGNDLARVLGYGAGWNGENVKGILAQVQDAQAVQLDRWNVMFDSTVEDKLNSPDPLLLSDAVSFKDDEVPVNRHPVNIVMSMGGTELHKPLSDAKVGIRGLVSASLPQVRYEVPKTIPEEDCEIEGKTLPSITEEPNDYKSSNHSSRCVTSCYKNTNLVDEGVITIAEDRVHFTDSYFRTADPSNDSNTTDPSNDNNITCKTDEGILVATTLTEMDSDVTQPVVTKSDLNTNLLAADTNAVMYSSNIMTDQLNEQESRSSIASSTMSDTSICEDWRTSVTNVSEHTCGVQEGSNGNDSMSFESDMKVTTPPKVARRRSRSNPKHRFVHILSESDLEFGPFQSYEESSSSPGDETSDFRWEGKVDLLKLNSYDDTKSESSVTTASSDPDVLTSTEERTQKSFEMNSLDDIDTSKIQYSSQGPRHNSVSSDIVLPSESKEKTFGKKLSLPVTPSFSTVVETLPSSLEPENEVKLLVMSNYFGIGIDAELSLAFHLAREENPERCKSRFRNKALYFKAGLRKMTSRSVNLNNVLDLEVDNKKVELPSLRGLIFLNIGSWGGGANAWGSATSKRFRPPSLGDGMLEVLGVGGVAHMSQIYSGLRSGTRIAQGEFIRMNLKAEVAVQVDGEPWMQAPGRIVISASPQQALMLKKCKKKSR